MDSSTPRVAQPKYGRLLDDFHIGDVYHHPWEVTIDDGMLAMFAASFLDPNPLYSSRRFARELGFRDRVVPPLVLLNLALSFTVHDISEQAIAHLAYIDLKFPNAAYSGDTLSVFSEILSTRVSDSKPDRGVVHLRTTGVNQNGVTVVTFERKALIPTGRLEGRAHPEGVPVTSEATGSAEDSPSPEPHPKHIIDSMLPAELGGAIKMPRWRGRPRGSFEDFEPGDVILHSIGHTVGESEHMQLTILTRNSHPLHFDEVYCRERSFAKTRVVEGGLVFAWAASLASRDTTANALWEIGYDKGSHPAPVLAGDTLYAASRVIEKQNRDEQTGIVRFKLVGVKNERPATLLAAGRDLFEGKLDQKVFEIERTVLLPMRRTDP
ncbi:MAG TPA: MaoC family dehydratase [Blastocatellia bacterium]|nr:MaoC family dehydratase [Blastocatellia bacterium]